MFLFIDTTEKLTLGLVDRDFKWLEFQRFDLKSISSQIHKYIFEILKSNSTDLDTLDGLIYCAGPGSYTGMRVSEGLASILEWQGLKLYTFYHFEVPKLSGVEQGLWFSKAFKKETFVYEWSQTDSSKSLVKDEEFYIENAEKSFARGETATKHSVVSTDWMIEKESEVILKSVVGREKNQEIFYYRSLDQEFSKQ